MGRGCPGFLRHGGSPRRGQTLIEVLVALVILTVVVVLVSVDVSNMERVDSEADRSIEISAANYFLGVMKSDASFWATDWSSGPGDPCLAPLGPYTDAGPNQSPAPDWHSLPSPPAGCPDYPFTDAGGPQNGASGQSPAPAVGDRVLYMWNASRHLSDPFAADLTVWVKRDAGSPVFEYHAIRYEYPGATEPTGSASESPPQSPPTSPTPPPTSPTPHTSPTPKRSPTPKPSPTPIGV